MSPIKKMLKAAASLLGLLLGIQVATYMLVAERQLRKSLPTSFISSFYHTTDSIYIRDFYFSTCASYDHDSYHDAGLEAYEELVKQRFNVRFVRFADKTTYRFDNAEEQSSNLVYWAWYRTHGFNSPFIMTTDESLSLPKQSVNTKTHSVWILYRWVPFSIFAGTYYSESCE